MKPTQSIIQTEKKCYICGCTREEILSEHHCISGRGRRDIAERLGLKVWICYYCHKALHDNDNNDKEFDLQMKRKAQEVFEEKIGPRELWIEYFWKSYL